MQQTINLWRGESVVVCTPAGAIQARVIAAKEGPMTTPTGPIRMVDDTPDRLITVEEAAEVLGRTPRQVRNYIDHEGLPAHGARDRLILASDLTTWQHERWDDRRRWS